MNIVCVICQDRLQPSEEIFFTRCGHVFHFQCLSRWLERSKSCPQCREKVTENRIYRVYFTSPNSETASEISDRDSQNLDSSLQERIDSLQFQLLLKEKHIKYYATKNVTLEKQNTGLRQEVRKVESEIKRKNSDMHVLNEQITHFKEKYARYKFVTQKLYEKEKELEQFKKEFKECLEVYKNENVSLRHRINELENLINLSRQNVTQSDNQRNLDKNSSNVIQKVDVYSQTNTKRKKENQNTSLSPRIKTNEHQKTEMAAIKMDQGDVRITSDCSYPTIVKRTKLRSGNNSKTDGAIGWIDTKY